jgi:hypothetical protein
MLVWVMEQEERTATKYRVWLSGSGPGHDTSVELGVEEVAEVLIAEPAARPGHRRCAARDSSNAEVAVELLG